MHFPKIDRILSADDGMQPLVAKARELRALARLCNEFLPPELTGAIRAANLRDSRLVLLAANSAAAAKLKLLAEPLTDFLLKRGAKVNSVSVRLQPAGERKNVTQRRPAAQLSSAGLACLSELYATLSDSPAKRALKALLDRETRR